MRLDLSGRPVRIDRHPEMNVNLTTRCRSFYRDIAGFYFELGA